MDVVHPVRVALWTWLGLWLAGAWAGVALAGECGICAACSVPVPNPLIGRRGGMAGVRGWERGALHDPIVYNDSSLYFHVNMKVNSP
eukprot:scaffold125303_cov31-Tisochrysis_lutea.AAC.1